MGQCFYEVFWKTTVTLFCKGVQMRKNFLTVFVKVVSVNCCLTCERTAWHCESRWRTVTVFDLNTT